MNDVDAVGDVERLAERDCDVEQQRRVESSACQALLERLAVEQLHHQECVSIPGIPDVVNRADIRVLQRRDGPRLALKAFTGSDRAEEMPREYLDRDFTIQA